MDVIRDEIVTIRKRGAEDEITALSVTPGQYKEILKKYGTRKSVRKSNGDCFETYRRAQEAALPGEEILRHYRISPLTEGFEGAVVSFTRLFQMINEWSDSCMIEVINLPHSYGLEGEDGKIIVIFQEAEENEHTVIGRAVSDMEGGGQDEEGRNREL